ncbi:SEP2 [Symbiodinium sp. CCMP2592]|nr:SEP2 [Symbiodinium sp. CCMP2592]
MDPAAEPAAEPDSEADSTVSTVSAISRHLADLQRDHWALQEQFRAAQQDTQVLSDRCEYLECRIRVLESFENRIRALESARDYTNHRVVWLERIVQRAIRRQTGPVFWVWGSRKEPWKAAVVHSRSWADHEDDRRTAALEMWRLIILTSGKGTRVGKNLAKMQQEGSSADAVDQCLRDVFSAKSTSTLKARAASLAHYARWRASVGLDPAVFPLDEAEAYLYVCFLRSEGAPRSRAPRFREAINFAGAMLGADVSDASSSARIQGAANPQVQAVVVRKKVPLTVAQVRALEEFVLHSDNDLAAVLAGYALYCLHGRLRWSDAQHTEAEPTLDVHEGKGFLNAQLYHHKTANRGSLARHRLLPVSCISPGLAEGSWAEAWLERRRRLGLRASRGVPMMPRPLCTGGFDSLPLDPSLGALWLREVLKECQPLDLDFKWGDIATHSLKATLLSYMAKAGAPENLRAIAGYHLRSANSSTLEYSRDTLAPALHFLECMFLTITSGLFAPDATRAGRWTQGVRSVDDAIRFLSGKPAPSQASGPGTAEAAGADEVVQSDPESPAESIGSAGEAEEAGVSIFALGSDLQVSDDARRSVRCFQHKLSGVIHAARDDQPPDEGEMTVFRCGRFANRNYELLDEVHCVCGCEVTDDSILLMATDTCRGMHAGFVLEGRDVDSCNTMSAIDSEAVFLAKCTQLGLPEEARNQLKRKGWSTFGTFAFCVPGEPGRIAEDVFKTGVATPILGADGDEHHAKLRRLHFEAYALTAAELKRTAESTESDQPRKVPTAELAARYNVLQRRVSPLRLVDRLEPSHSLVNLAAQMLEDQRVRYIEWSKCTSRAQEINLVKEDSSLKVLQGGRTGAVKLVDPGSRLTAETKSDLEVMQALRRRGVAYELAAIMTFERHEELIDRLFMEYQREPMQGFHPVSLAQLQAADREIHVRMGEHTRAGLTPDASGALPLDAPLGKVLSGPHIHWMLMPRQKGSASVGDATEKPPKLPKPPKKTDPSKATDKDSRGDKDQNAGKGSGPNAADKPTKQRKVRFVMPKALIGGVPRDDSGNNICFDHNLKKCPNAAGSCPKGVSNFSDGGLWIADPQGNVPCPLSDEQAHGALTRRPASDRNAPLESSGVLRNSGKSIRPSFLEIFCGSAGLSAAVRKLGFQVLGVDHKPTAKHANAPFISLDLRDPEQQERLWVELRRADAVWLEFPDGLPTLADVDRDRVNSANLLYDFTAKVFRFCKSNGILCIVENPVGSLMWRTSWFRSEIPDGFWHELHACMYGSSRRKRTALLATCTLPGLMLQCDGAHKHKRWGRSRDPQTGQWKYATSEETAYPASFCAAAAREIQLALERVGVCVQPSESTDGAIAATFAQRQPRRGRGVVGPAEYKRLHRILLPRDFQPPECVPADPPPCLVDIPSGSKLLWTRVFVDGGVERREAEFGVYHTPQEFLQEAMATTHPFDSAVSIDGPNLRAIAYTLERGVAAVKQKRLSVLEHYRALEKSLRDDERELKQSMDPSVREVMGSKNLLLFKQMLLDAGVPDEHLFEDMVRGFRLTGPLEPSGLFPPKYKPASISVDELRRTASWSKHLIEAACRKASKDPNVARSVWEESLAQVKKGWLAGPFTWEQMDQKYGGTWVASKRFGVSQGDKVRAVDDLSQFQVNASVTETEKIQLEGLDDIVALARFHLGSTVAGTKVFRLPMSGGGVYQGRLHRDFRDGRARNLKGRALDLRSAYKQLARHPSDDWASVLGVLDPDTGTVSYFESAALPFGASSAVTGFNRAARALRIIMSRLLLLVNTSFFDDFCQLEIDGLTDSADQAALALLDLLGWEVSDGDKLKPFASEFTMLGAVLSFKDAGRGLIRIRNKPGRVEEIGDMVERLASDPGEGARSLPSLKGKLLFAASHVFGRCAQVATQLIHHAEKHQGSGAHACVEAAVRRALDTLKAAGDRQVNLWSEQPPVIVFTDGACEERGSQVTHGAVIVDVASQTHEVFGGHIPGPLVEAWRSSGRVQLIFFAELYPVLIARRTWGKVLRNRRALFFVDNEAAKAALIRNYSPLVDAASMLADIAELDVANHCFPWYCRVPSKSNFSDAASRLSFGEYEERFRKVLPVFAQGGRFWHATFTLCAVAYHLGETPVSGHYKALMIDHDNVYITDDNVQAVRCRPEDLSDCEHNALWPLGGLAFCSSGGGAKGDLLVALAGPLTHAPQYLAWFSLYRLAVHSQEELGSWAPTVRGLCHGAMQLQIILVVFNLLVPVYPLDCSQVIISLCRLCGASQRSAAYFMVALSLLCVVVLLASMAGALHLPVLAFGFSGFNLLLLFWLAFQTYQKALTPAVNAMRSVGLHGFAKLWNCSSPSAGRRDWLKAPSHALLKKIGLGMARYWNENFDNAIAAAGKNALVLFCSDFCPWCKNKLNTTWTELMAEWQGSDKVLVAHIDCGQPAYDLGGLSSPGSVPSVCKKHEIDPQSKWFRYKREWEADVLEAFIHERLVPKCIVRTQEHCEDKDLAYLSKHAGKSRESLQAEQKRQAKNSRVTS